MTKTTPRLWLGARVRLTPDGPLGRVAGFPRKQDGEPPLVTVAWDNGNTAYHDARTLIPAPEEDR